MRGPELSSGSDAIWGRTMVSAMGPCRASVMISMMTHGEGEVLEVVLNMVRP